MFRGNALAKIDDKGRLKLPASFRSVVEPRYGNEFFVTSFTGKSVRVYPLDEWREVESIFRPGAGNSSLKGAIVRFKNFVNYFGQTAAMDGQGRLLIHPLVRERAGIRSEVTVLGQGPFLEVWDRDTFRDELESNPPTPEDFETLEQFGI